MMSMADGGDIAARVQWMTYPAAAKALGLSVPAIRDLCLRLGWRRGKRDDGQAWVAVPLTELEREAEGSPYATGLDEGYPARVAQATADLIVARNEAESRAMAASREVVELREQLARAESERAAIGEALRVAEAARLQTSREAEEARQHAAEATRHAEEAAARAERAEAARRAIAEAPWWRRIRNPQG